jgi:hypothetical protein
VDPSDDIRSVAESTLNKALEIADYGIAGERFIYGNPTGLGLLEERQEMKERITRIESEIASHKNQITDLRHRVTALTISSEGYQKIRHRFLDIYRRDVIEDVDPKGRKNIREGNEAAHEGDAISDAQLYISEERSDEGVLIGLYGLTSAQISRLGKCRTLLLSLCNRKLMLYSQVR